jgi:anti-sigma B factor antagonist
MTGLSPRSTRTAYQVDGHVCLQLTGEIDMQAEGELTSYFQEVITRYPEMDVVVDLAGVSFLDSSGIRCLVDAQRDLGAQHRRLTIIGAHSVVLTALQITGVYDGLRGESP